MGMAIKAAPFTQPEHFEFTAENFAKAEEIIARYPDGRQQSAVMPLLTLAQQQHDGWLPKVALSYIASILGMAPMKVYEVASFYTMYNLQPVGSYHIQVCGTTPCWLRGAEDIMAACESKLGIKAGETTPDGKFTLTEVECLGACVNAPMLQVTHPEFDKFYEDLTPHTAQGILEVLASDHIPEAGSQAGRTSSEPSTGLTSLQGGKVAKPKLKTDITTLEDTGEPSEEALVRTAQKKAEPAKKAAPKKKVPAKKAAAKKTAEKKEPAKKPAAKKAPAKKPAAKKTSKKTTDKA